MRRGPKLDQPLADRNHREAGASITLAGEGVGGEQSAGIGAPRRHPLTRGVQGRGAERGTPLDHRAGAVEPDRESAGDVAMDVDAIGLAEVRSGIFRHGVELVRFIVHRAGTGQAGQDGRQLDLRMTVLERRLGRKRDRLRPLGLRHAEAEHHRRQRGRLRQKPHLTPGFRTRLTGAYRKARRAARTAIVMRRPKAANGSHKGTKAQRGLADAGLPAFSDRRCDKPLRGAFVPLCEPILLNLAGGRGSGRRAHHRLRRGPERRPAGSAAQIAAFSSSTRSVFSQVNRSPSGWRPKWP